MLFIIGLVVLTIFWIFMSCVTGTYLVKHYYSGEPDFDAPVTLFGALLWPITLLILLGVYVGNLL